MEATRRHRAFRMKPGFWSDLQLTARAIVAGMEHLNLVEPRFEPVYDVYLRSAVLHDKLLAAVAEPGINTDEFAGLLAAVGELGHAAGHVMAYGARLSQAGQAPGYEKLCEAIVEAFRTG